MQFHRLFLSRYSTGQLKRSQGADKCILSQMLKKYNSTIGKPVVKQRLDSLTPRSDQYVNSPCNSHTP